MQAQSTSYKLLNKMAAYTGINTSISNGITEHSAIINLTKQTAGKHTNYNYQKPFHWPPTLAR